MNSDTFLAFGDELVKIAFYQKLKGGFVNALREGWHGTAENPQGWMGQGKRFGGLTKYMPVGGKSMMALGTAMMLPQAVSKEDPSGQERSRAERVTGLAGNTVGGLIGGAAAMRAFPRSSILAPMVGGIAGGMLGEKAVTAPFHMFHRPAPVQQMAPTANYQQVPNQGYTA